MIKKLLTLLAISFCLNGKGQTPYNPACNNADFGLGNFTNWSGAIGFNPITDEALVLTGAGIYYGSNNTASNNCNYFEALMTANGGTDYYGGFPVVPPNGSGFSCRLGGDLINTAIDTCETGDPTNSGSSTGETIKITIPVTPANFLFTYHYAVVLSNAAHVGGENPYFRVELFDYTGTQITCDTYMVESDTTGSSVTPPGWFTSTKTDRNNPGTPVIYTGWLSNSINLAAHNALPVTIRFTAAGCTDGKHFGYAYFSGSCSPLELAVPCVGQNQTIVAPANGFGGSYAWAGPGIVSGANSQTVACNKPGHYTVTITNQQGCSYTLDTAITTLPSLNISASADSIAVGGTATLTATGALSYTWSTGATTNSITVAPLSDTTYTVIAIDTSKACLNVSDTAVIHIKVTNPNGTGIKQVAGSNVQVTLYPNPAKNNIQVSFTGNTANNTLIITDMLGNMVKQLIIHNSSLVIDVSDLSEGVYTVSLHSNEGVVNKRVVIVR